ncbi:JmjC domain-containing histone demethylation protein [Rhizoctonia solani AG-1 IA]|uniref:JmjC domain-containing histone demethylation protein 1 n=1 Tax=Thanatephorus cucumeris (strain AG1-IA) TaxID=983506 RepID=L8X0Z2_THACA|nr:JmjC domain-containing histone demethylation protein [Rhizoctonia solani AG-1 IA]
MAATRRSSRLSSVAKPDPKRETSEETWDRCAACKPDAVRSSSSKAKTVWAECEKCGTWFHWDCVGEGGDINLVDKWYCKTCLASHPELQITLLPPTRKSTRKRARLDYANIEAGVPHDQSDPNRWMTIIQDKPIHPDSFKRVRGDELSKEWVERNEWAMTEPVVIDSPDGLGMMMPSEPEFGINDVVELVGADVPVEVIDVATQATSPGWTLGSWAEYYNTPEPKRDKIRNVISLEVSGTKLAEKICPPRLVREIDWVEHVWPAGKKGKGQYPKVQLYCLMSVAQCWTVFYFVEPTPANLNAYEKWSGSENQSTTWFGDLVDKVTKVELAAGNTIDLKAKEEISPRILEGLASLATFVVSEVRMIERGGKEKEKEAKEQIPGDRVREPGALARELRWRVRNARGIDSDSEGPSTSSPVPPTNGATAGAKRKRTETPIPASTSTSVSTSAPVPVPAPSAPNAAPAPVQAEEEKMESPVMFRNFVPRKWTEVRRDSAVTTCFVDPSSIQEEEAMDKLVQEGTVGAAELQTKVDTIVKTRRYKDKEQGGKTVVERQTITRTLDIYTWDENITRDVDVPMEIANDSATVS